MATLALRPLELPPTTLEHEDEAMALEARRAMERRMLRLTPDGPRRDLPLDHAKAALRLALKLCGVWQRGLTNGLDICYRTVELRFARLPRAPSTAIAFCTSAIRTSMPATGSPKRSSARSRAQRWTCAC